MERAVGGKREHLCLEKSAKRLRRAGPCSGRGGDEVTETSRWPRGKSPVILVREDSERPEKPALSTR